MNTSAESLNELGRDLQRAGRVADAEQAYESAAAADPSWSVPSYNLGLLYKVAGRWTDSIRCNERAVELDPTDGDAWWNLGIAATAVGDWRRARHAWKNCGIEIPEGEGEIRMNLGPVPIRLNPDADGEVVWCNRIDPARAIIQNIPLPESGYRQGDLLLHDGAPNGYRMWNERQYPVFDALQVLIPSTDSTYELIVYAPEYAAIATLEELAVRAGVALEDWESINWICRQCSEGVEHIEHDRTPGPWRSERRIGLSLKSEDEAANLLKTWIAISTQARVLRLRCVSAA